MLNQTAFSARSYLLVEDVLHPWLIKVLEGEQDPWGDEVSAVFVRAPLPDVVVVGDGEGGGGLVRPGEGEGGGAHTFDSVANLGAGMAEGRRQIR